MRRLLVVAIALVLVLSPSSGAAGQATPETDTNTPSSGAAGQATPDANTIEYGVVAGNAFAFLEDEIEDMPSGDVGVVAWGPTDVRAGGYYEGAIAAVVYNGTDAELVAGFSFRFRDGEGRLVATIPERGSRPSVIEAGGLGLVLSPAPEAAVGMSDLELEPRVNIYQPSDESASMGVALEIVELAPTGKGVVGIAENTTSERITPVGFSIVCFDEDGKVTGGGVTSADIDPIGPGEDTSFSFKSSDIGGIPCDYFLVAGSGGR